MEQKIQPRDVLKMLQTYIPGKPIEEVQKEFNLSQVIKLASNENPLGPSPKAVKKLQDILPSLNLYPDGASILLKKTIAEFYGINENSVILGNGSDELLMLIALGYLSRNDEVLISEQTFSEYIFTSTCLEAKITKVPQKNFTYDLPAFTHAISDTTKIIYLCNPNNPTGTIYTTSEFEAFMEKVPANILVVVDEAYYEYVDNKDYPQTLDYISKYRNLLLLRTFSKIYGLAGLRAGYAIGEPQTIITLNKVREPFNVNSAAQIAAIEALKDQLHTAKVRSLNEQAKQYLYDLFTANQVNYVPSEANFILFQVNDDAQTVFQKFLRYGVIVRAMTGFGLSDHIRVTTGTMEQMKIFAEIFIKLKENGEL